jgi:hypothetical protein
VGRKALRSGGNIMTDIAANMSFEDKPRDIVDRRLSESVQNDVLKMRGVGKGIHVAATVTK